jgi:hypothetical protein
MRYKAATKSKKPWYFWMRKRRLKVASTVEKPKELKTEVYEAIEIESAEEMSGSQKMIIWESEKEVR